MARLLHLNAYRDFSNLFLSRGACGAAKDRPAKSCFTVYCHTSVNSRFFHRTFKFFKNLFVYGAFGNNFQQFAGIAVSGCIKIR